MEGEEGKQWFNGLLKEYNRFFDIKNWKLTKRADAKLGHGNKPLTTKNIYKKKLHAITKEPWYQVWNCIQGFNMIAGVHYDASFAPTPTNTMVRTVFAICLYILQQLGVSLEELHRIKKEEWVVGNLFDIVQAFLNSELNYEKNPIYILLPPYWKQYCEQWGIEYDPTDLILLLKSQYGAVNSAKLWVDKLIKILTEKGGCEMIRSKVDPCVLYMKDKVGKLVLLLVFHIDDGYIAGKPEEVCKLMVHLESAVEVLNVGRMDDHLGVSYKLMKDNVGWYYECHMKKYITKAIVEYEHDMKIELQEQWNLMSQLRSWIELSSSGITLARYFMQCWRYCRIAQTWFEIWHATWLLQARSIRRHWNVYLDIWSIITGQWSFVHQRSFESLQCLTVIGQLTRMIEGASQAISLWSVERLLSLGNRRITSFEQLWVRNYGWHYARSRLVFHNEPVEGIGWRPTTQTKFHLWRQHREFVSGTEQFSQSKNKAHWHQAKIHVWLGGKQALRTSTHENQREYKWC
jgi:Reverse transcriptase (RNA-dependent DNA polymerase)